MSDVNASYVFEVLAGRRLVPVSSTTRLEPSGCYQADTSSSESMSVGQRIAVPLLFPQLIVD